MPRNRNKNKTKHAGPAHPVQHRQMAAQPTHKKKKHLGTMVAVARSDQKIRTTQASNTLALKSAKGEGVRDSEKAAVGILDPFAAFQRQYKTGLPFATTTLPCFGFWTRHIVRATEIPFGASPALGCAFVVVPSCNPNVFEANSLDPNGIPLTFTATPDPNFAFITANFETVAVGYQGVRVRNLTPVLNQGGEMVIGLTNYNDATLNPFTDIRSASTTITHSNGDPGVIAQCSYMGNPNDNARGPTLVADYRFTDPGVSGVDPESRCMVVRTLGSTSVAQVYEIEIVTYYLGVPFSNTSQIFAPVRYDVTPSVVNRMLDKAYSISPMLSIPRNFVKDDGWDTMWTGAKAIIADIGGGLIGAAASAIGSAFASLFDAKHRHRGMQRLINLCPSHAWDDFRKLVTEHQTRSLALAALQDTPPPSRFSTSEMDEIIAALRARDCVGPATAGVSTPGWKVFSR